MVTLSHRSGRYGDSGHGDANSLLLAWERHLTCTLILTAREVRRGAKKRFFIGGPICGPCTCSRCEGGTGTARGGWLWRIRRACSACENGWVQAARCEGPACRQLRRNITVEVPPYFEGLPRRRECPYILLSGKGEPGKPSGDLTVYLQSEALLPQAIIHRDRACSPLGRRWRGRLARDFAHALGRVRGGDRRRDRAPHSPSRSSSSGPVREF